MGVHDLRFLGYPDGRVEPTLGLRKDLARVIRQVRPDRLVCPSPERNYLRIAASHPDHRAVGSAALDAVYPDARNPFALPELLADEALEPWTVREVWISAGPGADHYVDITDTFRRKVAALRAHESQTGHMDDLEEFLRGWLTRTARGAASQRAAWPRRSRSSTPADPYRALLKVSSASPGCIRMSGSGYWCASGRPA